MQHQRCRGWCLYLHPHRLLLRRCRCDALVLVGGQQQQSRSVPPKFWVTDWAMGPALLAFVQGLLPANFEVLSPWAISWVMAPSLMAFVQVLLPVCCHTDWEM